MNDVTFKIGRRIGAHASTSRLHIPSLGLDLGGCQCPGQGLRGHLAGTSQLGHGLGRGPHNCHPRRTSFSHPPRTTPPLHIYQSPYTSVRSSAEDFHAGSSPRAPCPWGRGDHGTRNIRCNNKNTFRKPHLIRMRYQRFCNYLIFFCN